MSTTGRQSWHPYRGTHAKDFLVLTDYLNSKRELPLNIVYAKESFLADQEPSLFLAGPTPRSADVPSWRPDALRYLQEFGFKGKVFVPETSDGKWRGNYLDQVEWEKSALDAATLILFWVPRNMETMPALTTNVEFGRYVGTKKVVLAFPTDAVNVRYLEWMYRDVVGRTPINNLKEAISICLEILAGREQDSPSEKR